MTVVSEGCGLQERSQIVFVGQGLAVGPGRALAQGLQRRFRAMLGFADDARETAVAHHSDEAGYRADTVVLQPGEFRARVLRPQHAAVQHFRQCPIVDEARLREHLVGDVDPLHRVSGQRAARGRFRLHIRRCVAIERDFFRKFPIAGRDIARSRNGAVLDIERVDPHAQPFRRQLKKDLAHLGAGMAQRASGLLHGEAA